MDEYPREALVAKAAFLGHRRGWTGLYHELKSRRAEKGRTFPVCTCPECGRTLVIRDTLCNRFATAK